MLVVSIAAGTSVARPRAGSIEWRQDAHVMPAMTELLGERGDVPGHASRVAPRVRRDKCDAHRHHVRSRGVEGSDQAILGIAGGAPTASDLGIAGGQLTTGE
jgi:hypothetical protein